MGRGGLTPKSLVGDSADGDSGCESGSLRPGALAIGVAGSCWIESSKDWSRDAGVTISWSPITFAESENYGIYEGRRALMRSFAHSSRLRSRLRLASNRSEVGDAWEACSPIMMDRDMSVSHGLTGGCRSG